MWWEAAENYCLLGINGTLCMFATFFTWFRWNFVQEMYTEMYGLICKFRSTRHTVLKALHEFLIVWFGWNYIYMWTVKHYDIFKVVNTLVKPVYCVTELGTRWHYKLEGRRFDFRGVIGILHWLKLFGCTVTQGFDSACARNEYQELSPEW